jgi:predicted HAD superfamily Cof-like phosphohydrolase
MNKIPEPNALNDVAEFHTTFELPIVKTPEIPSAKRCALRVNLLQEELNELKEAIEQNDLVEVADALCDIQYVLSGAILEFGLQEKFKSLFDEVHRSNMSKTCKTIEIAKATEAHYAAKDGTDSNIVKRGSEFIVYREADGKVLKSVEYSPADLNSLI